MNFASDRQRASFEHAERSRDKMLMAGPPEPALFTVTFRTRAFAEGPYNTLDQVQSWLRERLGADATITPVEDDETACFDIEDSVDEVTDEDAARDVIENLIGGGPHQMVLDGIEIDDPTDDEPDWDAIAKDRRLDEEFDD